MYIKDLTHLPPGYPPSPYGFPLPIKKGDRWGTGHLPEGLLVIAAGWLGNTVPNPGDTPPDTIRRLWQAFREKRFFSDGTAGWHDCELCQREADWYPGGKVGPVVRWGWRRMRIRGHGHFLIRQGMTVYMAPVLILHYILDHGYQPPAEFLEAVLEGEFLTQENLIWIENTD